MGDPNHDGLDHSLLSLISNDSLEISDLPKSWAMDGSWPQASSEIFARNGNGNGSASPSSMLATGPLPSSLSVLAPHSSVMASNDLGTSPHGMPPPPLQLHGGAMNAVLNGGMHGGLGNGANHLNHHHHHLGSANGGGGVTDNSGSSAAAVIIGRLSPQQQTSPPHPPAQQFVPQQFEPQQHFEQQQQQQQQQFEQQQQQQQQFEQQQQQQLQQQQQQQFEQQQQQQQFEQQQQQQQQLEQQQQQQQQFEPSPPQPTAHGLPAASSLLQQQHLIHRAHQQHSHDLGQLSQLQGSLQAQHKALAEREDEVSRLQRLLRERDEELARRDAAQRKAQKAREGELHALKASLTREKEEKLAKLSAAHNLRMAEKEEEMSALRLSAQREKEASLAKLESVHAKQLKQKEEEGHASRSFATKEKDEKVAKLQGTIKELKGSAASVLDLKATIAKKDAEVLALRKQLGAAQRVEDDLRKQQKEASTQGEKLERGKKDELQRLRSSIDVVHAAELRKLSEEHEQQAAAKARETEKAAGVLKAAQARLAQSQQQLQLERGKLRSAIHSSRELAEIEMSFGEGEEARLLKKVEASVEECTERELHWLMTRTFRTWLAQSYSECDEVCDALEAEQQQLKRTFQSKEQELCRYRAQTAELRGALVWAYQVFMLTMAGSMATGCAGVWRAVSTGQLWPSLQIMAFAWLLMLATAVGVLFLDSGGSAPPSPPRRASSGAASGGGGAIAGVSSGAGDEANVAAPIRRGGNGFTPMRDRAAAAAAARMD